MCLYFFLQLRSYLFLCCLSARKQSRMDETQRREVYTLFTSYEKLKKELYYYDECDLVYNIAGRIELLTSNGVKNTRDDTLFPIDSIFVE